MTNKIRYSGIAHCCGEADSGKTRFFLGCAPISRTAFFHDDVKMLPKPVIDKLGLYVDVVQECKGKKMLETCQYLLEKLDKIKPGDYDAIVFDTWSRMGQALRYWGKSHAADFRELSTFSLMGKMKNGEEWKEADRYEAQVISDLASKAPFIGLVTHLKDVYEGGAKTSKQAPDAGKVFDRVCNFRVWLRKNKDSGVPIALVLKRLSEDVVNKDGWLETVNVMPWKLTPLPEHKSVWDVIDYYRANPYGNRSPEKEESPDAFEMSILTGVMTKEQREIWQANLRDKLLQDKEELSLLASEDEKIREFVAGKNGMPLPLLLKATQDEALVQGWNRVIDMGYIAQVVG